MNVKGTRAALALIFLLFGFMLATQFRARPPIATNITYQRAEELAVLLKTTEEERDVLKEEVKTLRDRVAEMSAGESQVEFLKEQLFEARLLAGLVAVKGPGIVIEMTDSPKPAAPGQDPNVFLIHDDDVLKVVNELFAAGAEAVSINGQRLVSTTEIRCAGPVFIINGVRVAPPLTICAIGEPDTLEDALKMRGGVVDSLSLWGIEIKIRQEPEVTVPAYSGSLRFQYAKAAKEEGSK